MNTKEAKLLNIFKKYAEIEKPTLLIDGNLTDLLISNNLETKDIYTDFIMFSIYKYNLIINFEINIRDIKELTVKEDSGEKFKKVYIETPNLDFYEVFFKLLKDLKPKHYRIYNKKDIESILSFLI